MTDTQTNQISQLNAHIVGLVKKIKYAESQMDFVAVKRLRLKLAQAKAERDRIEKSVTF